MKIFVCVKQVPDVSEADIKVAPGGKSVDLGRLPMEMNGADNCAVEEALRMKEANGGSVQTVTIGPGEDDVMIRMALAKGCDSSIRIEYPELSARTSPLAIAKILAAAIKGKEFDLVLTGAMASDAGNMAVGVALAGELGVSHASMVKKVDLESGRVRVVRELEGGGGEVLEVTLPAVLTIQTGINKPRYAQILGIRAAQKKELKVQTLEDLGLTADGVQGSGRSVHFDKFYFPEVASKAEYLAGEPQAKAEVLAGKMIQWGVL